MNVLTVLLPVHPAKKLKRTLSCTDCCAERWLEFSGRAHPPVDPAVISPVGGVESSAPQGSTVPGPLYFCCPFLWSEKMKHYHKAYKNASDPKIWKTHWYLKRFLSNQTSQLLSLKMPQNPQNMSVTHTLSEHGRSQNYDNNTAILWAWWRKRNMNNVFLFFLSVPCT